jgi:hypothetical protein
MFLVFFIVTLDKYKLQVLIKQVFAIRHRNQINIFPVYKNNYSKIDLFRVCAENTLQYKLVHIIIQFETSISYVITVIFDCCNQS